MMPPMKMQMKSTWQPAAMAESSFFLCGLHTSTATRKRIEIRRAISRRNKCCSASTRTSQPVRMVRCMRLATLDRGAPTDCQGAGATKREQGRRRRAG
eukprot:2096832-Prymnesium_polylepis.1